MFERTARCAAVLAVACTASFAIAAASGPNPQQILSQVDKIRNPAAAFAVNNIATEYKSGKATGQAAFVIQSKLDGRTAQYRNVIGYVAPARDAGKLILMNGAAMWFYDPNSRQSIRISPQQRLIGGASNADVLAINLARDYKANVAAPETVKNADQAVRQSWRLDMKPSSPQAAYGRIEYWVDRETLLPIKGRFYADSRRLLKTVFYSNFKPAMGGQRPTKVTIIDQLNSAHVTTMQFQNFRRSDVPDSYFEREYLSRIKVR
jgi:outer membrane lipoprotein-sorting protein